MSFLGGRQNLTLSQSQMEPNEFLKSAEKKKKKEKRKEK